MYIDLEIDGEAFRIGKGDVWKLFCIAQTAFDKMKDPSEIDPLTKEYCLNELKDL